MPESENPDGPDSNQTKLTPTQEAAIEKIKTSSGGVAAGRAMFEERLSPAARRRLAGN